MSSTASRSSCSRCWSIIRSTPAAASSASRSAACATRAAHPRVAVLRQQRRAVALLDPAVDHPLRAPHGVGLGRRPRPPWSSSRARASRGRGRGARTPRPAASAGRGTRRPCRQTTLYSCASRTATCDRAPPARAADDQRRVRPLHRPAAAPRRRRAGSGGRRRRTTRVVHWPTMTSACSSNTSMRSPSGANGKPKAACSRSCQPAPSPSSARPPEMWSTVVAARAEHRRVAERRRRHHRPEADPLACGPRGRPGSSRHRASRAGGAVAERHVVVRAEEPLEARRARTSRRARATAAR